MAVPLSHEERLVAGTRRVHNADGLTRRVWLSPRPRQRHGFGSNLDATGNRGYGSRSHMLLSFQRPSRPRTGTPSYGAPEKKTAPRTGGLRSSTGATDECSTVPPPS